MERKTGMGSPLLVELPCGGRQLVTTRKLLERVPDSRLAQDPLCVLGRDAALVGLLVDALRRPDFRVVLPDEFSQWEELRAEARFLRLPECIETSLRASPPRLITLSAHASLSTARMGADVNFRKVLRIVVSGKVSECRRVFGDWLNEGRDGHTNFDSEETRYTTRFFLTHASLERAFDRLSNRGYRLVTTANFAPCTTPAQAQQDLFIHHTQYHFESSCIEQPLPVIPAQ